MVENSFENFTSRLDLIQQSNWNIEEGVIKNQGNIEKQNATLSEIKSILELINGKLDKIDLEIRALRNLNDN